MYCDLHMHSTASDGTDPPESLPRLAKEAGVGAIALTDHDTTAGVAACARACQRYGVAFAPGIEISADPHALLDRAAAAHAPLGTLHVLGYFIRHDDPKLGQVQERMRAARDQRNPAIVEKLQQLGISIDYREVADLAIEQGTQVIGRPHIALVLMRKGYVKSIQDAFHRYLGQGAPGYVRRDRLDPAEAIEAIHHAGGLAVLAHPVQLRCRSADELEYIVARLKQIGLDGIESHHSDHTPRDAARYAELADRHGLLTTGGSDYHGQRKDAALGGGQLPMSMFEALRKAWQARSASE